MTAPAPAPQTPAAPTPAPRVSAPRRRRALPPVDVAGKHGPVWATLDVAGWLLAAGATGDAINAPAWAIPPLAFIAMLGALAVARLRGYSAAALWVRVGCWVGGCLWLTWVLKFHPGWVTAATVVVLGALVAGCFAPIAARRRKKKADDAERSADARRMHQLDAIALDWTQRLRTVCPHIPAAEVLAVEPWAGGGGFDLDVDLHGPSWRKLLPYLDAFAASARLPAGCGVSVGQGVHRGRAIVSVSTVNKLDETRRLPEEYGPLSVLNGLFIGWVQSGAELIGDIRQATWLIIARKGGGKTTLLHVALSWLTRATDCIPIVIDMNAGGLGVPWAAAWMEGRAKRPAIEWLAGDAEEARLVARAMLAVALGRKRRAGRLKRLLNVTLMPIGNGVRQLIGKEEVALPAEVVIVIDEGREIFGDQAQHRDLHRDLMQIQAIARDAGVNLVISGLDGTSSTVSTFVKKQCAQKVCLPVETEAEIGYVLDWNTGLRPEDFTGPGYGFARLDDAGAPAPFRVPEMLPDQIDRCSIAVADLRPAFTKEDLEDIERALGPGVFEARWERARRWFDVDNGGDEGPTAAEPPKPRPPGPDMGTAVAAMNDALDVARAAAAEAAAETKGRAPKAEPAADVDALNALYAMPSAQEPRPGQRPTEAAPAPTSGPDRRDLAAQTRMWELLEDAGTAGASPQQLANLLQREGHSTNRQTVHKWLTAELNNRCVQTARGTYVWRQTR